MAGKRISPLKAGFWLTEQEKVYLLVVCAVLLIGFVARYFHLKNKAPTVYTPAVAEETDHG